MRFSLLVLLLLGMLVPWGGPVLAQEGQGAPEATENPRWSEDCSMLTDSPADAAQKAGCPPAAQEEAGQAAPAAEQAPSDSSTPAESPAPIDSQTSAPAPNEAQAPVGSSVPAVSQAPPEPPETPAPSVEAEPGPMLAQPEPQSAGDSQFQEVPEVRQPAYEGLEEEDLAEVQSSPQDWVDSKER